jgi:membrane-bound lytic murein transglycosylase F
MLSKVFAFLDTRGHRLIALIAAILVVLSIVLFMLLSSSELREKLEYTEQENLESIFKKGKLIAICENSTISFFKNRNISLGYEYEILKHIANKLNLKLEVLPFAGAQEMNRALIENEGHLIADFRVVGNSSPYNFIYTRAHTMSVISLVQRIPAKRDKNPKPLITNIYDLEGKTIHVQINSIAHKKLKYFADEYALQLGIVASQDTRENLLEKLSRGDIEYTVIEREIIAANSQLFDNLDYSLDMSFPYRIAFTLRGNSVELRDTINSILDSFLVSESYAKIFEKYISGDQKNFHRKISLLLMNGTELSRLDKKIKIESAKINWDWRLLSALIYKESRFEAYATSRQGTYGLMQFVPRTGAKHGVFPNSTPEAQIEGGVRYLSFLQRLFPDVSPEQKPKFVLASYNGGPSHVLDAQCAARHFNEDPNDWAVVSKYLLKLNQADIQNLDCIKNGAYNGQAVINYVNAVYDKFYEFCQTYPAK